MPAAAKELGMTEEEAGRRLRYEAMEEYAKKVGADKIALAHHRDDRRRRYCFICSGAAVPEVSLGMPVKEDLLSDLFYLSAGRKLSVSG